MELLSLPTEVLQRTLRHADVTTTLNVSVACRQLEAVANGESTWKHHIEALLRDALEIAPVPLAEMDEEELVSSSGNSGIRSSHWKLRYAQILRISYPESISIEKSQRELRRKAISVALRSTKSGLVSAVPVASSATFEGQIVTEPSEEDKLVLKYLERVRHVPVRVAILGNEGVGRTEACMKHIISFASDQPLRPDAVHALAPHVDRFGSNIFTKCEKGIGNWDFQVTIIDPPSRDESAQIASLRAVDAVMIGFAVDNEASIRAVVDKWIPFVQRRLGPHVPISAIGFKYDIMADGLSGTAIHEILSSAGIRSFEICVPPYKRSFWRAWKPDNCPLPDGDWN